MRKALPFPRLLEKGLPASGSGRDKVNFYFFLKTNK